jgi:hypothetical protein
VGYEEGVPQDVSIGRELAASPTSARQKSQDAMAREGRADGSRWISVDDLICGGASVVLCAAARVKVNLAKNGEREVFSRWGIGSFFWREENRELGCICYGGGTIGHKRGRRGDVGSWTVDTHSSIVASYVLVYD